MLLFNLLELQRKDNKTLKGFSTGNPWTRELGIGYQCPLDNAPLVVARRPRRATSSALLASNYRRRLQRSFQVVSFKPKALRLLGRGGKYNSALARLIESRFPKCRVLRHH